MARRESETKRIIEEVEGVMEPKTAEGGNKTRDLPDEEILEKALRSLGLKEAEVLGWKEHEDKVVIVTTAGQKLIYKK